MNKTNILYVHAHDAGRYLQPYGHAIPSPHIQRLAEQGVLFRSAFCAGPTCSPSRAALVTGQYPHNCGMLGLAHRGFALNDYKHHMLHTLREHGYYSVLAGVQHIASHDETEKIGYDEVLPVPELDAVTCADKAVEFLKKPISKPWFMSVGCWEPHRHIDTPDKRFSCEAPDDDGRYCLPPSPLADTPEIRKDMANFKAGILAFDDMVGQVLLALYETGQAENTLVICTTDHGIAFPFMKCNLTDFGTGVLLTMRGPGGLHGGRVIDAMVSHVDLFPTICDQLAIETPDWLDGVSILPLIRRETGVCREEVFAEVNYHAAYEPMRSVRTNRWKYIRRFEGRGHPILPNCDDSPSKCAYIDRNWANRPPATEQLYDLFFDPNEMHNLVGGPAFSEVLSDMRTRLRGWMKQTNDPLVNNSVVIPPDDAISNDPDSISPTEPSP